MAETIGSFSKFQYTAKGLMLESKLKTGKPLKITRAVIGSGILSEGESVATLTALKSEIPSHQTGTTSSTATVDIVNVDVISAGTVNIRIRIKNGDTDFYLHEIGIMAEDPDEGEILYMYTRCDDNAQGFPKFTGANNVYRTIDFLNIITESSSVKVDVTLNAEVTFDVFNSKIAELNNKIEQLKSIKKIDLEYSISQGGHDGYNIVVKPKVNYIARKEVSGTATYPTQAYDKCYMYICYNYDSDSISLICGTTVSGRGPQPPDNYIFSAEISSSSDCGNFEYHRLIQKGDDGNPEIVQ